MNTKWNVKKTVTFNNNVIEHITYSPREYDRSQIDSILYRRGYQRVSDQEWNSVHIILDIYKMFEMNVHKDAYKNNQYHTKPKEL
jgi:hypothetical protein